MSIVKVAILKSIQDWRKGEVVEMIGEWAFQLIREGYAEEICDDAYDLVCLEKYQKGISMKIKGR